MLSRPIEHLFEFWSYLGHAGGYFHHDNGYDYLTPKDATWPSKVFNLKASFTGQLKLRMYANSLPKSVAVEQDGSLEKILTHNGFVKTSVVKGMTLQVTPKMVFTSYTEIEKVKDAKGLQLFTNIASKAFGYTIYPSTLIALLNDKNVQLFIGRHQKDYVSCGILFLDRMGHSGLHMIGTKREFRGLGLGRQMTEHLLHHALRNKNTNIHLVASKLGAPIYEKLGFKTKGYLSSYTL